MLTAERGNLSNLLKQQKEPIDWILRIKWAMQLSNVLVHLHNQGLIHRDVRCVNILVTEEYDLKLSGWRNSN